MDPTVDIIHSVTKEQFQNDIYPKRRPVILRGLELGPCLKTWTPQHLSEMGGDKAVKVHVSPTSKMDFINKNFAYRTLPFDELVRRAAKSTQNDFFFSEDEKYYLRMVGADARKDVADFRKDFPNLSKEIIFPQFYNEKSYFSSVLRIGSPGIQLWTHYDIMDNFLIQVSGKKRVVLFSPKDTTNLYLNGDKSEVLDIDNPNLEKYPNFSKVTKIECFLEAGDVLFIPALWFHNVISLDFSVAVNVFWKHLDDKFYDKKDIYGNKDLVQASQSMQGLDRALKLLDELPMEYKDFYGRRDKSEVLDIDNPNLEKYPNFSKVTKIECFLEAGDVLFIPALWFHNVISLDFSVAVNVFWKHLDDKFYDKKDIYGNKDLVQASQSMQGLDRALKLLDELPMEYKDFYGRRMISKIQSRTFSEN